MCPVAARCHCEEPVKTSSFFCSSSLRVCCSFLVLPLTLPATTSRRSPDGRHRAYLRVIRNHASVTFTLTVLFKSQVQAKSRTGTKKKNNTSQFYEATSNIKHYNTANNKQKSIPRPSSYCVLLAQELSPGIIAQPTAVRYYLWKSPCWVTNQSIDSIRFDSSMCRRQS